ncbi:hypothetical protein [Streptomyces sp. NBC_00091]|uniref:hypothetical protein n=1 Tax=Streptomyces sp. NBC_00091 TaxID=2975648 RepID=UPI0022556019|nr:hypothetical protein [Streptomyces sp. NBC_00091]MCX5376601.1 hypothetical protein [Streptomyces sp. NBC_00091]
MSTPPPNPYSGAPVPPDPYAGAPAAQNPYGQPAGAGHPAPGPGYPGPGPAEGAGYPQPGPGYPGAAPGYPQQPYPQQYQQPQHPQYGGAYPHAQMPGCRNCGAPEAANFAVRAHVGVLVLMRFHTLNGPFCRQCGRALVRVMTTKTLCQGWWSPFSLVIFTPFTLLWNLIAAIKFSKLAPSAPAPGRQPLEEGPPVHARPLAYVAIIPLLWATWVAVNIFLDVTGRR